MIDNLKMSFPNQAIPSIFGESTSYLQQLSYIAYKLQQTIDEVNSMQAQGLPVVSAADNGKIAEVVEGEWRPTTSLMTLDATVDGLNDTVIGHTVEIAVLQRQMDSLYDDIVTLGATLTQIVQGQVDEEV